MRLHPKCGLNTKYPNAEGFLAKRAHIGMESNARINEKD